MSKLLVIYQHSVDFDILDNSENEHHHLKFVFYSNQKTALATVWALPPGEYECEWYTSTVSAMGSVKSYEEENVHYLDFSSFSGTINYSYNESDDSNQGTNDVVKGELNKIPFQNKLLCL